MLNKNQSKKRNSWKYYAILPALVVFVVLFQIETIAQEKAPNIIEKINPDEVEAIEVFTIEKNTTDAQIDQRVKTLKEKFNISALISELKRNSNNEITSININLRDKKGVNQFKKSEIPTGIEKIGIIIITKKDGTISFYFPDAEPKTINEKTEAKDVLIKIKDTQISNTTNDVKTNSDTDTNINTNVNTNTVVKTNEDVVRIVTKTDAKPIIVINGKFASPEFNINSIDPNKISYMNVLKGIEAKAKYGDIENNTIIEIVTKVKIGENEFEELQAPRAIEGHERKEYNGWKVAFGKNASGNVLSTVTENKNIDFKKAVIIIDGKISDYRALEKINQSDIKMVKCPDMKNYSEEQKNEAVKVYGEKAKNGFIEVQTTEYYDKHKNVHQGFQMLK